MVQIYLKNFDNIILIFFKRFYFSNTIEFLFITFIVIIKPMTVQLIIK